MGAFGLARRLFCLLTVGFWWTAPASPIVSADEPANSKADSAAPDTATSVQQEPDTASPPPKVTWAYNAFVDTAYLLDFNHPANHLFRNRSTAFKVDELDLNMAGAGVKRLASGNSRWGMELAVQAARTRRTSASRQRRRMLAARIGCATSLLRTYPTWRRGGRGLPCKRPF